MPNYFLNDTSWMNTLSVLPCVYTSYHYHVQSSNKYMYKESMCRVHGGQLDVTNLSKFAISMDWWLSWLSVVYRTRGENNKNHDFCK